MTSSESMSIRKRLLSIPRMAVTMSAVIIVILLVGFISLFNVRDHERRSRDILIYLEKAAGNMNQVSMVMQSYLLNPGENGIWDEKELYETSAVSFLALAKEISFDGEMTS